MLGVVMAGSSGLISGHGPLMLPIRFETQSDDPISYYGEPVEGESTKSRILRFCWSASPVSCSNWSGRGTKSQSGTGPLSGTVVGQTDFDTIIGQCLASDRNLACAVSYDSA